MSTSRFSPHHGDHWWSQLGLRNQGLASTSRHEHRIAEAVLAVLREHPPVAFAGNSENSPLSIEEMVALIKTAADEAEHVCQEERRLAAETRRAEGQARVEAALAMPDAGVVITDGRWAGFTKGEAFAWCWTLFQYEPYGFVHPGTQVRHEAMEQLERGDLPSVFGYPERATELAAQGLNVRQYRLHKEALGAATFDPADVRH